MKALVLLLSLSSVCWCKPTTIVNFSPVGNTPGIAPGFAYAFRTRTPVYAPSPVYSGGRSLLPDPLTNSISAPEAEPHTILKTQYHSQDQLGQYAFGYVGDASVAHEIRTLDGSVRGSYTYLDGNGEIQTANYVADDKGFRVEATNLPLAPPVPVVPKMSLPQPVQPTPEVAAATAAHLKAVAEIRASRRPKRSEPSKGYLPPPPAEKKSAYVTDSVKVEPVAVPVEKIESAPIPFEVSYVPFAVPPPAVVSHEPTSFQVLPGPFPFHTAATHAVPTELQSLSPIPTPISLPIILPVAESVHTPVPAVPSQVVSQFHAQNELGGFEYGYEGGPSSKHEVRTPDGVTRGSYSYIDANGELQTVSYVADDVHGFRVLATNLPVAPADQWASKKDAA